MEKNKDELMNELEKIIADANRYAWLMENYKGEIAKMLICDPGDIDNEIDSDMRDEWA